MTADDRETLVVHIGKALQGQHMVRSCPFMRPSTSNDDDDDDDDDDADDRETLVVHIGKANMVARPTHGWISPIYEPALNIP